MNIIKISARIYSICRTKEFFTRFKLVLSKKKFIKKFKPTSEEIKVVEDAAEQFLAECEALFDFYNNKAVYFDKD